MPWRLKGRDKFSTPQKKPTNSTNSTNSLWATDGAPSTMGSRTLKCANIFTPRTLNRCPSARWFSKCGRCSGAIYSQYNMGNLLSLSREGDITSSRKGIMDNLSMTYDGSRLASVSDSTPGPSGRARRTSATGCQRPWSTPTAGPAMESTWSAGTWRSAAGPMAWKSQGLAVH